MTGPGPESPLTSRTNDWRRRLAALLVVAAIAGTVLTAIAFASRDTDSRVAKQPIAIEAGGSLAGTLRLICALVEHNGAQAGISGTDGGSAVELAGRSHWLFGDTFLDRDPGFVPAAVAWTTDGDASDCIELTFKAEDGIALSLFPVVDGETTAWPEGVIAVGDDAYFYYASVTRDSPALWRVNHVGVGTFDSGVEGARVATVWRGDAVFGSAVIGARSPIRVNEHIYVFLFLQDHRHVLARVPATDVVDPSDYAYWDGDEFTGRGADAVSLWPVDTGGALPLHNGMSVMYDDELALWLALYNESLDHVTLRTAASLTGPWSAPQHLLDCRREFGTRWPTCYGAEWHPELTASTGHKLYFSVGSGEPYDVWLVELELAR